MGARRVGVGVAVRTGVGQDQEVPAEAGLQGASLVPRLRLARVMSHAAGLVRARRIRGTGVSPQIVPMAPPAARLKGSGQGAEASLRIVWTPVDV